MQKKNSNSLQYIIFIFKNDKKVNNFFTHRYLHIFLSGQRFRTRKSRCFSPLNLSSPGLLRFPSRHPHAASWISEVALMHDSPHQVVAQTASFKLLWRNYGGLFFPLFAVPQNPVQSNKSKLNITHIKQKLQYTDNLNTLVHFNHATYRTETSSLRKCVSPSGFKSSQTNPASAHMVLIMIPNLLTPLG